MRFHIENIGKIQEADIALNGLTVITGENDCGKSTIGKLLFSTIKALSNNLYIPVGDLQKSLLQKHVQSLYRRLSRKIRTENKSLDQLFPLSSGHLVSKLQSIQDSSSLDKFLAERTAAVNQLPNVAPRIRKLMLQDIKNIGICLKESDNRAAGIASEIQYFIESEFMNKICSHATPYSQVELFMDEQDEYTLSYTIKENVVGKVAFSDNSECLQDATYVESPLYLHILDALLRSENYRETEERMLFRSMIPIHVKDFAEKLNAMKFLLKKASPFKENFDRMREDLHAIVGGHFTFDEEMRSLCFFDGKNSFSPINIASGIKSFGVIQMLLETNAINENKILIWDEPENHLHPQWQIEFANVLLELAKAGIPVVISTHSPYFIQGIRYFSVKHNMEKFVNYYLANTQKNGLSVFDDVSEDLNRIFVKLAEPLNRIMNVDGSHLKNR